MNLHNRGDDLDLKTFFIAAVRLCIAICTGVWWVVAVVLGFVVVYALLLSGLAVVCGAACLVADLLLVPRALFIPTMVVVSWVLYQIRGQINGEDPNKLWTLSVLFFILALTMLVYAFVSLGIFLVDKFADTSIQQGYISDSDEHRLLWVLLVWSGIGLGVLGVLWLIDVLPQSSEHLKRQRTILMCAVFSLCVFLTIGDNWALLVMSGIGLGWVLWLISWLCQKRKIEVGEEVERAQVRK